MANCRDLRPALLVLLAVPYCCAAAANGTVLAFGLFDAGTERSLLALVEN